MAEMYSVLSGMPRPYRVPPLMALQLVRQARDHVRTVSLTEAEYLATMEDLAPRGLMGGIVFDALLMRCARKINAARIYSLNPTDLRLIDEEWAARIVRP
jgi:predicted nucleic acid-binding protein